MEPVEKLHNIVNPSSNILYTNVINKNTKVRLFTDNTISERKTTIWAPNKPNLNYIINTYIR